MSDIKTYIQEHLKTCRGLDMSKLLAACGMYRAKFYKCLKEPWRFGDEELERIAQELQLEEQDRRTLFAFKYGDVSDNSIAETNHFDEDEREKLYPLVEQIIFSERDVSTDCSQNIFTIFHEASAGQKKEVCSADELAKHICDDINKDFEPKQGPQIYITIFNSCDDELIKVVYSLLRGLSNQPLSKNNDVVSMTHFIGRDDVSLEEKLRIYAESSGLMRYGRYELMFTNPYKGSLFESWNGMLLRYADSTKTFKYLMISVYSSDDATIFAFSDNNLFEFLRCGVQKLFWEEDSRSLLSTDALEVSKRLVKCRAEYPTVAFGEGICLDHIPPTLYDEKIMELTSENNDWKGYDKLVKAAGAQDISNMHGRNKTIKMLFNGFKQRFNVGENAKMINFLSASGLQEFARTGQNIDMKLVDIGFDQKQTISELKYLKEHLDGAAEGQSYYIINSPVVPHSKILHIIKGYRIAMAFTDTTAFESASASALYLKSQIDWDTEDIFYDYVMNQLLSRERRNRPDSPIMSKEWAEDFVEGLIKIAEAADSAKYNQ